VSETLLYEVSDDDDVEDAYEVSDDDDVQGVKLNI